MSLPVEQERKSGTGRAMSRRDFLRQMEAVGITILAGGGISMAVSTGSLMSADGETRVQIQREYPNGPERTKAGVTRWQSRYQELINGNAKTWVGLVTLPLGLLAFGYGMLIATDASFQGQDLDKQTPTISQPASAISGS